MTTAATPSNQNVEAYNALLQGNFYNDRNTAEDTRKAIGYYEEAIRLDPRLRARPCEAVGRGDNLAFGYGFRCERKRGGDCKSSRLGASALELDPNLAEAHSAQGVVLRDIDFNFAAAEAEFRRAFELAPQNPA